MWGLLGALIVAGLIIIILLIVGQLLYKKNPKLTYILWGSAVLLLAYFIYSFNTTNTRLGNLDKEKYVGTYKIDFYNSSYDSVDLSNYKDLFLAVKIDNTFEFSEKVPFFTDKTGHWQHMDNGDISWTEISVGDKYKNLMEANVDTEKWIFSGRELSNGNGKNKIMFIRQ